MVFNSFGKHHFFHILTYLNQLVYGIMMPNASDFRLDNRSCIELFSHIMSRGSDDFHSPFVCRMMVFPRQKQEGAKSGCC